jgi:outer membrane receptor protein involved in Fe transport
LVAAAQQDVKEWSHEILENARLRRAAHGSSVRDSGPDSPEPTDEEINEEIVVTAQKRATALQEVPFSVAALTNEDIEQSGATNIVDVARNVPGLYITDLGPGQSQVAIRGISAGQVVRDQPGVKESVGIYLDESPISVALFTPDLDLYDLDRIEVLRGRRAPCTGAGNDAGTVRYITAQPDIGVFGGSVDATFNSLTDGEFGGALRGAINVPIVSRRPCARWLLQRTARLHRFGVSRPRHLAMTSTAARAPAGVSPSASSRTSTS